MLAEIAYTDRTWLRKVPGIVAEAAREAMHRVTRVFMASILISCNKSADLNLMEDRALRSVSM